MSNLTVSLSPHVHDKGTTRRIMLDVLLALVPSLVMGVVVFGLNALVTVLLSMVSAMACEALAQKWRKKPITIFKDYSAALTGLLLGLTLPPNPAWYVPVCGSAFAILIAKQVFGGLGHNFVNPALAGRAFLLACWPVEMTSFVGLDGMTSATQVDALSSATPIVERMGEGWMLNSFLGFIPGSIGEVSKIALLVGVVYLLARRVIDLRIPLAYLLSLMLLSWAFGMDPLGSVLLGGVVLGAFFMATDYVTSPITSIGKIIFGVGCGVITFAIRKWGAYPEGVTYAILFMNVCTPLIERFTRPKVYGEVKKRA